MAFGSCDRDGDGFGSVGSACPNPTDCNDLDPRAYPGADPCGDYLEDLDCDGLSGTDDPDVGPLVPIALDRDGDGRVSPLLPSGEEVLWPSGCIPAGFSVSEGLDADCDDLDPLKYQLQTGFVDADGDAVPDGDARVSVCAEEPFPWLIESAGLDCDPFNPDANACLETLCFDGRDNDGDGLEDHWDADCEASPLSLTRFVDADGDGLGDPDLPDPDGVHNAADCDDSDPAIGVRYADQDGDGYGSTTMSCETGSVNNKWDCNDFDPAVTHGATYYLIDEDGDGAGLYPYTDCPDLPGAITLRDCDDDDATVAEGFPELCDVVDHNCDGLAYPAVGVCPTEVECFDGIDDDGDGLSDCEDVDCLDVEGFCIEIACADGIDSDRDGLTDCEDDDCLGDRACMQTRFSILGGTWESSWATDASRGDTYATGVASFIPVGGTWQASVPETCVFTIRGWHWWTQSPPSGGFNWNLKSGCEGSRLGDWYRTRPLERLSTTSSEASRYGGWKRGVVAPAGPFYLSDVP